MISRSTDIRSALRAKQQGFIMNPSRFGSGGGSGAVPLSGLKAYYDLNDNPYDSSSAEAHAVAGSVSYTTGKIHKGGSFVAATPSSLVVPFRLPGDFTITAWMKPSSLPAVDSLVLFADWRGSARNLLVLLTPAGGLACNTGNGGSSEGTVLTASSMFVVDTWVFVTITRTAGVLKVYKNGSTLIAASGTMYTGGTTTNAFVLGADSGKSAGYGFSGVMDLIGLWDRALTTLEIDGLYDSGAGVELQESAALLTKVSLLHMNGTDTSTTFTDTSGIVWTPSGAAAITTAVSKFGGACYAGNGSNSFLTAATSSDLTMGLADFTIEFWVRVNVAGSYQRMISSTVGGFTPNDICIRLNNSGKIVAYTGGADFLTGPTLSTGTWYSVALTRAGSTTRLFVDGSVVDTRGDTGDCSVQVKYIGGYYSIGSTEYLNGNIDEVRITKNSALYTASYTPAGAAFT